MTDETLLDDSAGLQAADHAGRLRAAAAAGAHVRATAEAADEYGLRELAGARPRALVLLERPGVGQSMVRLLAALLPRTCQVPVVRADLVPGWIGPLDVVLGHSDDPGDVPLAESLALAGRRGARVLLTAEPDGPVAAAAAGSAIVLPPRVATPPGFGFARALAAGLLLMRVLDLLDTDIDALADALDGEAERCHPDQESFVNPAKALALRLTDRTPLLWGTDAPAAAVASYAVRVLAAHAGVVGDAAEFADARARTALWRAAVRATSGESLFADPDDPDAAGLALRTVLLSVSAASPSQDAAHRMLPGADLLAPAEEFGEAGRVPAVCAAGMCLRFELTALYLGLVAGRLGGSGAVSSVPV